MAVMEPIRNTHNSLNFTSTDEKFYFASGCSTEVLVIDRFSFEFSLARIDVVPHNAVPRRVCLLLGIIHLISGPYLILVTNKRSIGSIGTHSVYEVTETELVSFSKTTIHLSELQERDNERFVGMVEYVLTKPGFYFSYTFDLTHTLQRCHHFSSLKTNFFSLPLHERADKQFMWNHNLMQDLLVLPELHRFIVPVVHGFVSINKAVVNGIPVTFSIISRRSTERAGVRYYRRGIDTTGNVANFVETEQLLYCCGKVASFVQTRGSIPLHWSQKPCLKYKPAAVIINCPIQKQSLQKHFDQQITQYGQQVVISLIDQKGSERVLGETLRRYVLSLASCLIWFVDFDFHKECSKMRWHRLSILTDRVATKQDEFGYFMKDESGTVLCVQQGVFRTNCMDCLDRTNVVQSLLAHKALLYQMRMSGVLKATETVKVHEDFETIFKNVWADNADTCAKQYAGTGALKTDFTRSGKRTYLGMVKDGQNSAVRYFYNNFMDGYRQDAIDLFLGKYAVNQLEMQSFPRIRRPRKYYVMPALLLISFSMLFLSILIPGGDTFTQMLHTFFWSAPALGTLVYICIHGEEFVDVPQLSPAADSML